MATNPVSYDGDTVLIDTKLMLINRPYWLLYRNMQVIAQKHKDGSVSLYRVPNWFMKLLGWVL